MTGAGMPLTNPTEIARETLKQLAMSRQLPTPDNYRKAYAQISGDTLETAHPVIQLLTDALPQGGRPRVELQRLQKQLDDALKAEDWNSWSRVVLELLSGGSADAGELSQPWGEVVRELVRQWELRQVSWTPARKKEALERVVINFGGNPVQLNEKLAGLIRGWRDNLPPDADTVLSGELDADGRSAAEERNGDNVDGEVFQAWRDLLASTLEYGVVARLQHAPDLLEEASALNVRLREVADSRALQAFSVQAKKFWIKLELRNESDQTLMLGLQRLLRLLVSNIGELMADDGWMQGQVEVIKAVIDQPLDSRYLYEMEQRLSELIFKQGHLKQSLTEAKLTFKHMITTFIDRLGVIAESTGGYHDKIVSYSSQIQKTDDVTQLSIILDNLMEDTRHMQVDMLRSRDDMRLARQEAEAAESRISELEREIEAISAQVKTDQLTGTLNRRGLEEAMATELARVRREQGALSVALLDIDNFKKLNDSLGHQAGDEALTHLSAVVKDVLRPTDYIARYGGEEFVVLLPGTGMAEAIQVMQRVQRELTRRFYLHRNERVLITFSCGVAEYQEDESQQDVLARADAAMYRAKVSGKNRVEAAD